MATVATSAALHHALVLDRQELAPGVVLLGFDAPELVRVTRPGQFIMAIPPSGERAATALGIYEASGNRASVMFFVVGKRTAELASLGIGDRIALFGPLGNGFTIDRARNAAIVAGGGGIASVLLPAQALLRAGARVRLYYGARAAGLLVDRERFASDGCEVLVSTDDASMGHAGYIPDLLAQTDDPPDLILAC